MHGLVCGPLCSSLSGNVFPLPLSLALSIVLRSNGVANERVNVGNSTLSPAVPAFERCHKARGPHDFCLAHELGLACYRSVSLTVLPAVGLVGLGGRNRSPRLMATALIAGLHRIIRLASPSSVGSWDWVTGRDIRQMASKNPAGSARGLADDHDGICAMTGIEDSWARVTAWIAANAPASYATLNPPAPPAELDACERDMNVALPAELRRLLLVSNGAADFDADGTYHRGAAFLPGGHRLLSAAELAKESRDLVDLVGDAGDDLIGYWWHPDWVLFGRHIAADGMAIDQRPGPGQGAIGEFIHETGTEFTMAASLGQYIAKMADSIENGTDFMHYRPLVQDGSLDWDVIVEEDEAED
jgi:cell wall assembly regulator SMI1